MSNQSLSCNSTSTSVDLFTTGATKTITIGTASDTIVYPSQTIGGNVKYTGTVTVQNSDNSRSLTLSTGTFTAVTLGSSLLFLNIEVEWTANPLTNGDNAFIVFSNTSFLNTSTRRRWLNMYVEDGTSGTAGVDVHGVIENTATRIRLYYTYPATGTSGAMQGSGAIANLSGSTGHIFISGVIENED